MFACARRLTRCVQYNVVDVCTTNGLRCLIGPGATPLVPDTLAGIQAKLIELLPTCTNAANLDVLKLFDINVPVCIINEFESVLTITV